MSDFPAPVQSVTDTHLSIASLGYGPRFSNYFTVNIAIVSTNWVSGVAVYQPFSLPHPYLVSRVFWANGGTVASTNVDMGIYTADGTKIYSTTPTVMGTFSSIQYVVVAAPFTLQPGRYYLAWTCNNTTGRANCYATTADQGRGLGMLQQASVPTLPDTATFAAYTGGGAPFCGITRTSTGF